VSGTADVAVAGAGPAGAVAACLLARGGRSAVLIDPRIGRAPEPKPGDALAGAALRLLRGCGLPLPRDGGAHRRIGGNLSVWGGAEPVHRDFLGEPDGPSWRLDRPAFEAGLVDAATAAGARTVADAVAGAERDGDRWRVRLRGGGELRARWIVDATGRAAAVARRLGARRHTDEPLVAVVGRGRPDPAHRFARSIVETVPEGWWYAALLPDGTPTFMLHTGPEEAARLLAAPDAWRAALAATRHVAAAFPAPAFDAPPRGYEACGARLDPAWGDGWAACGDAALSCDPCSAQGILSALHGGMAVAGAVAAALAGDTAPLAAYAAQLAGIRAIYRDRVRQHYAEERRWPDAPFWRQRASWRRAGSGAGS